MRRATAFALALLLMVLAHIACAEAAISRKAQLNQANMTVGVNTGSASSLIVEKELPNAQLVYFEDNATAYEAVAQGKIDAYIFDRVQIQQAIRNGRGGVHLLDENMDETVKVAVGISPVSAIPDIEGKLGQFLADLRQDGTLADMYHRWAEAGDTQMPDIQMPTAPEYHLKVGTAGIVPPFSYYVGTDLNGYDIEMARRFAAWLNADLEFKVYDFGAIIPAAVSGDVDCIMSNLNVTEERRETIKFSEIIYENTIGILVGQLLGAGELERAVDEDRKLIAFSVASSVLVAGLMALVSPWIPQLYNTTPAVRRLAVELLMVGAVMMPLHAYANACYFTIRSGGKTLITFAFDSLFVWATQIPLAMILSRLTALPIVPLYVAVEGLNVLKCLVGAAMLRSKKWVVNLVE